MDDEAIATQVVDAAVKVHKALGPGMLESAYRHVLAWELEARGIEVAMEVPIGLRWEDRALERAFRVDLIAGRRILVETKATTRPHPVDQRQVLTYLRWTGLRVGFLLNFGFKRMSEGIHRHVLDRPLRESFVASVPSCVPAERTKTPSARRMHQGTDPIAHARLPDRSCPRIPRRPVPTR